MGRGGRRTVYRGIGGDGGIRTLDRALQPYNGLANRRLQPLGHISGRADMPEAGASRKRQIQAAGFPAPYRRIMSPTGQRAVRIFSSEQASGRRIPDGSGPHGQAAAPCIGSGGALSRKSIPSRKNSGLCEPVRAAWNHRGDDRMARRPPEDGCKKETVRRTSNPRGAGRDRSSCSRRCPEGDLAAPVKRRVGHPAYIGHSCRIVRWIVQVSWIVPGPRDVAGRSIRACEGLGRRKAAGRLPAHRCAPEMEPIENILIKQRLLMKVRSRLRVICATPLQKRADSAHSERFLYCVCRSLR